MLGWLLGHSEGLLGCSEWFLGCSGWLLLVTRLILCNKVF